MIFNTKKQRIIKAVENVNIIYNGLRLSEGDIYEKRMKIIMFLDLLENPGKDINLNSLLDYIKIKNSKDRGSFEDLIE